MLHSVAGIILLSVQQETKDAATLLSTCSWLEIKAVLPMVPGYRFVPGLFGASEHNMFTYKILTLELQNVPWTCCTHVYLMFLPYSLNCTSSSF